MLPVSTELGLFVSSNVLYTLQLKIHLDLNWIYYIGSKTMQNLAFSIFGYFRMERNEIERFFWQIYNSFVFLSTRLRFVGVYLIPGQAVFLPMVLGQK